MKIDLFEKNIFNEWVFFVFTIAYPFDGLMKNATNYRIDFH